MRHNQWHPDKRPTERIYPEALLKTRDNGRGYCAINYYNRTFYAHRLVAEAFLGDGTDLEVNHKDGNKANNLLENLEYTTRLENQKHASTTGLLQTTFSDDDIRWIRAWFSEGVRINSLARLYGKRLGTISNIVHRRQRKYVAGFPETA